MGVVLSDHPQNLLQLFFKPSMLGGFLLYDDNIMFKQKLLLTIILFGFTALPVASLADTSTLSQPTSSGSNLQPNSTTDVQSSPGNSISSSGDSSQSLQPTPADSATTQQYLNGELSSAPIAGVAATQARVHSDFYTYLVVVVIFILVLITLVSLQKKNKPKVNAFEVTDGLENLDSTTQSLDDPSQTELVSTPAPATITKKKTKTKKKGKHKVRSKKKTK
jgi:hypothetical protein